MTATAGGNPPDTTESPAPRAIPPFSRRLRSIRDGMQLGRSEFAALIRAAGDEVGEPNTCDKRLVERWELKDFWGCRPIYRRALTHVTGLSYEQLCAPWVEAQPLASNADPDILSAIDGLIAHLQRVRATLADHR